MPAVLLLKIVGGISAAMGALNIVELTWAGGGMWSESAAMSTSVGLIYNAIIFVIPGLALYGLGVFRARMQAAAARRSVEIARKALPPEERLKRLGDLKVRGLITEAEYTARRAEIMAKI